MEFIESPLFTKYLPSYLNEEEYAALQWHLAFHPEKGDLIPGSGGLRKLRWMAKGQGKRGGIRVIYYHQLSAHQIWLLTLYAKSEVENISNDVLKKIKKELDL